ncbi:CHAD domain-containing protein [Nocardioides sp. GXQ0305]|uniref:CHAD domain-containing protein n=1 Tax=Nocardioides sp. GXQ0305 TaxID=3423912 RepID=UPI003D7DF932
MTEAGAASPPLLSPDVAAGAVVHQRLSLQVAELHHREHQVRLGDTQEGVHRARIASRRLRSALATFGSLLDTEVAASLRGELRWLSRVLGDARDPQVSWERLGELLEAEPADEVSGPVQQRLDTTYAARIAAGEAQLAHALASDRHLALLGRLDGLVADPPWSPLAEQPAADVLRGLLARDWHRLEGRMVAAADADDGAEALHDARKAAKRLRYGAETLRPAWEEDARRLAAAARDLSDHLGERQDLVLVRTDLAAMADAAEGAGEPSRTWGALLGRADERRRHLDLVLGDVWRRTAQPELRDWLQ